MTGRLLSRLVPLALALAGLVAPVGAHGAAGGAGAAESLTVPLWLVLLTGGAVVGVSFLLASFLTDRALVAALHEWHRPLPGTASPALDRVASLLGATLGVATLAMVLTAGLVGPATPSNPALVLVWVGWWAGVTALTYFAGNLWPLVNPWRRLAAALPSWSSAPALGQAGVWLAVAGLLGLVWLEAVSPLSAAPGLLAVTIVAYTVVTLAGSALVGPDRWFHTVDPVARVYRSYGALAPIGRPTADAEGITDRAGLVVRLPGSGLLRSLDVRGRAGVAFLVALLWVTTYDGLVRTPAWRDFAGIVVPLGVPPAVLYPLALVGGFAGFLGVWFLAARASKRLAATPLSAKALAVRFAPSLVPIAAGYHFAHYVAYFLRSLPALAAAVRAPLSAVDAAALSLPGWVIGLGLASVLLGHLLAIWLAHAAAFELFPGRLQAIRSQYPFVVVMVLYTMSSLWIVAQPEVASPYL